MTDDAIQIREFREGDLDAVVAFSLRAWEPVFDSIREVLGDEIFLRLHPDWRSNQADAVKSSCLSEQRDVFVAVADGKPVGFAAVALNAFHEGMGVIEIIGVDPDHQRRGISSRLTEHATEHMQRSWHGHRGRRDRRRSRPRTCAGGIRSRRLHAAPDRPLFPNARVTFRNTGPCDDLRS